MSAATAPARRLTALRALAAQTAVELRLTLRRGESMLVAVVIPAALLLFFSLVPVLPVGGRPVDSLLPGAVAIAVMATAMVSLGIATGFERHYGVLKRLGGTPLTRAQLLGAKAASVLAIEALQVGVLVALAALVGWRGRVGLPALLLGVGLGTAAFAGIGFLLAGILRAEANLAVTNGLFLVLLLLGGSVVPADRLPGALAAAAGALPGAPLTAVLRWAFGAGAAPGAALAVLAGWAAAAPLAAALTFSWE